MCLVRFLFVAGLSVLCAAQAWAQRYDAEQGRFDYVLHCSGCHAPDGSGVSSGGIPPVKDQIGYFLTLPEGRAFLMQVSGLLGAGLTDERAAGVTNWMIEQFAGPSMPKDFLPISAEEARRYRLAKPADIVGTRDAIAARLIEAGYPIK
ncbi:MAG: cytochrome c [Burkholderiales bacterium]|nr:cytochrome c [Burkholderiales bacterium]